MKKYIILILLTIFLVLEGCAGSETVNLWDALPDESPPAQENTSVVLLSHSKSESSTIHRAALMFQQSLQSISGGHMQVLVFPDDTLGSRSGGSGAVLNETVDLRIGRSIDAIEEIIGWLPILTDVDFRMPMQKIIFVP